MCGRTFREKRPSDLYILLYKKLVYKKLSTVGYSHATTLV